MIDAPFDDYISASSTPFFAEATGTRKSGDLLWGDGVKSLGVSQHGRTKVRARGRNRIGWVHTGTLGGKSLLEFYFIDVGQGDGVLVKTPDFRHLLIDGGHPRKSQNTGKSAADFVDWKFYEDYGLDQIALDAMIVSHNDFDHYGGLADLLDVAQEAELDVETISIEAFYHAGISWWLDANGKRTLGPFVKNPADGKQYYMQLLGDRVSAKSATDGQTAPQLQGEWGDFIGKVVAARRRNSQPTPVARIGRHTGHLPGFAPASGKTAIAVLGPVQATVAGKPGLLKLGVDSKTTNGNSILLRVDYGRTRTLLTGDLNKASQQALLEAYAGDRLAFQCDVAKACHHGSEDVSFAFLQAMNAAVTVISSGDAEGHDHPRPRIVAASGASGYLTVVKDEIVTPLVYSTELARSVALGEPTAISIPRAGEPALTSQGRELAGGTVEYSYRKPGALRPQKGRRRFRGTCVVAGLIYGLVNVRTDGETILTATMNEGDGSWSLKTLPSRF